MLKQLLKDIEEETLDAIIEDGFKWLKKEVGDNSEVLTSLKKKSKITTPWNRRGLSVHWSYYRKNLKLKRDYLAAMHWSTNQIHLHCNKKHTLKATLEIFFHEYCHSQQNSYIYNYYSTVLKVPYDRHPLEREANEFAEKMVPRYWQENSWKFG